MVAGLDAPWPPTPVTLSAIASREDWEIDGRAFKQIDAVGQSDAEPT